MKENAQHTLQKEYSWYKGGIKTRTDKILDGMRKELHIDEREWNTPLNPPEIVLEYYSVSSTQKGTPRKAGPQYAHALTIEIDASLHVMENTIDLDHEGKVNELLQNPQYQSLQQQQQYFSRWERYLKNPQQTLLSKDEMKRLAKVRGCIKPHVDEKAETAITPSYKKDLSVLFDQREIEDIITHEHSLYQYIGDHPSKKRQESKQKEFIYLMNILNNTLTRDFDLVLDPHNTKVLSEVTFKRLSLIYERLAPRDVPKSFINTLCLKESFIKKTSYFSKNDFQEILNEERNKYKDFLTNYSSQRNYVGTAMDHFTRVASFYKELIQRIFYHELNKQHNFDWDTTTHDKKQYLLFLEGLSHHITLSLIEEYIQRPCVNLHMKKIDLKTGETVELKKIIDEGIIHSHQRLRTNALAQILAKEKYEDADDPNEFALHMKQINTFLEKLQSQGYTFSSVQTEATIIMMDETSREKVNMSFDIPVWSGDRATWKTVWRDIKNGRLVFKN